MASVVIIALLSAHYFEKPLSKMLNERFSGVFTSRRKFSSAT
jgi:peptidoglycan/LPS O-acetylase OafA/YrhL